MTALVGANGTGKSAALQALARLFGTGQGDRTLVRSDFHRPAGTDWDDIEKVDLLIEARLEFPELVGSGGSSAVAACFKHMTVQQEGESPYCRVRLEGTWSRSNLPDGEVEQRLVWVTSPEGTDDKDEKTHSVASHERSRIHVHYVPAARDPSRQLKQVSGSLLHTLLRAVEWSQETRDAISEATEAIREAFGSEKGVETIHAAITTCWAQLHGAPEHREVGIRPVERELTDVIRNIEAVFSPGPAEREDGLESLSEGQRSLFYLSLVAALFDVQESVGEGPDSPINRDRLAPPILNLLAVEEPENHIAPHYLGRIMVVLRRVAQAKRGQVVISSHSSSILARVDPEEVRHLRIGPGRRTLVREVVLPEEHEEHHKFIREAVQAYPELYFSRFVVLGEGDSEQLILPRLAEAVGTPLDTSFVSVVPLGGRHVSHFWRLLGQLEIPFVTLLDLDRERHGGGWGRIKYAIEQLLAAGIPRETLLTVESDGKSSVLSDEDVAGMHEWPVTEVENLRDWVRDLEEEGVFFSAPLDIDFLMLRRFPAAYKPLSDGALGPRIPAEDDEGYEDALSEAAKAVLGEASADSATYSPSQKNDFFWYRYLFLGRGKPATHIAALSRIEDPDLVEKAPKVLRRLLDRAYASIKEPETPDDDAT